MILRGTWETSGREEPGGFGEEALRENLLLAMLGDILGGHGH